MREMFDRTRQMQEKIIDLEGRSRRNNIRIFGLPEDTEGNSVIKYVEQLLKTELQLPEEMTLQIQRAHRALAQKPGPNTTPRSIVVNFLQFETKEMILTKAWQKKIQVGNKQIFDYDYPETKVIHRHQKGAGGRGNSFSDTAYKNTDTLEQWSENV